MWIKRSDITEESHWIWECPYCGQYNTIDDDPEDYCYDDVCCEGCKITLTVED